MSVRRATSQLLPVRSVHLRISPRPSNLSESREIYRVLQRFGELDLFKWLKYEYHNPTPNIVLAIYRTEAAAQKALDASPIRFALEKVISVPSDNTQSQHGFDEQARREHEEHEDATEDLATRSSTSTQPTKDGIDEILRPSTLSTRIRTSSKLPSSKPEPSMPFDPRPSPSHTTITRTQRKWFQVTVDRSRAVHRDFIERQPFWKYYDPMKSMAQSDLEKKVPHVGLSDVSKRLPNAHRTPNKVLKQMHEYFDRAMPSLRGISEGSEMEKRFMARRRLKGLE